jgi:hypothetical protein
LTYSYKSSIREQSGVGATSSSSGPISIQSLRGCVLSCYHLCSCAMTRTQECIVGGWITACCIVGAWRCHLAYLYPHSINQLETNVCVRGVSMTQSTAISQTDGLLAATEQGSQIQNLQIQKTVKKILRLCVSQCSYRTYLKIHEAMTHENMRNVVCDVISMT